MLVQLVSSCPAIYIQIHRTQSKQRQPRGMPRGKVIREQVV